MQTYDIRNKTYQQMLLQNKAQHEFNKSNSKPVTDSNRVRPQSAPKKNRRYSIKPSVADFSASHDISMPHDISTPHSPNNNDSNNHGQIQPHELSYTQNVTGSFTQRPNSSPNATSRTLIRPTSPGRKPFLTGARKREIDRIQEENLQLLNKLKTVKPAIITRNNWEKHIQNHKKYALNISHFDRQRNLKPKVVILHREYLTPVMSQYINKESRNSSKTNLFSPANSFRRSSYTPDISRNMSFDEQDRAIQEISQSGNSILVRDLIQQSKQRGKQMVKNSQAIVNGI